MDGTAHRILARGTRVPAVAGGGNAGLGLDDVCKADLDLTAIEPTISPLDPTDWQLERSGLQVIVLRRGEIGQFASQGKGWTRREVRDLVEPMVGPLFESD